MKKLLEGMTMDEKITFIFFLIPVNAILLTALIVLCIANY